MPRTALQWASLDGDALRVRWLLSSGENPNADDWVSAPPAPFLSVRSFGVTGREALAPWLRWPRMCSRRTGCAGTVWPHGASLRLQEGPRDGGAIAACC